MADQSHIDILAQGVSAWNDWQKKYPYIDPKLDGADLSGRDLSGTLLVSADLSRAVLSYARLIGAKLSRSNLTSAILHGADVAEAILYRANIAGTDLSGALNLTQAQVDAAFGDASTKLPAGVTAPWDWRPYRDILRESAALGNEWRKKHERAPLDLSATSFIGANLQRVDFWKCDLRNCDFSNANLQYANLEDANLTGACFDHTSLSDANLTSANINDAMFSMAKGLAQDQLEDARGNEETKLPEHLAAPLQWSRYRSTSLLRSLQFDFTSGPLRSYLRRPLSELANGRTLAIVLAGESPIIFQSEEALPAADLRRAFFVALNSELRAVELCRFAVAAELFRNFVLQLTADISLNLASLLSDEKRLRAECTVTLTRGTRHVLERLQDTWLQQEHEWRYENIEKPLGSEFVRLFGEGEIVQVSNLRMCLRTPEAAQERPSLRSQAGPGRSGEIMADSPSQRARLGPSTEPKTVSWDGMIDVVTVNGEEISAAAISDSGTGVDHINFMLPDDLAAAARLRALAYKISLDMDASRGPQEVWCSVFAPACVELGAAIEIQVVLHWHKEILHVVRAAMKANPSARRRGYQALGARLEHGQTVTVYLECPDLLVAEPIRSTRWEGRVRAIAFPAEVISGTKKAALQGVAHVCVDEIPIGEVPFDLTVIAPAALAAGNVDHCAMAFANVAGIRDPQPVVPVSKEARRYRKAFLSYSRKDVAYASIFAEGLSSNEIELFVDVTSLEPGDDWNSTIKEAIRNADLFFLLWSRNAHESKWVLGECEEACAQWQSTRGLKPLIRPMVLQEGVPKPPHCIADLHCDSRWRLMRLAGEHPLFSPNKDTAQSGS
jgi:uncharacterized protein YjbI with pentapeptide repeats